MRTLFYTIITRETESFTEEELENWPSFFVGFWNDPDKQLLIIEERFNAFQHTETVSTLIEKAINKHLDKKQLRMHIEALFNVEDFWKIIDDYKDKIVSINFELITPNMSNISASLSDDLKEFAKNTNTSSTNMLITSDRDSALNIQRTNEQLAGIVEYSSEGGGNIKVKAKGLRKTIQTSKTKRSIELDELLITGNTPDEIAKTITGLLSC